MKRCWTVDNKNPILLLYTVEEVEIEMDCFYIEVNTVTFQHNNSWKGFFCISCDFSDWGPKLRKDVLCLGPPNLGTLETLSVIVSL